MDTIPIIVLALIALSAIAVWIITARRRSAREQFDAMMRDQIRNPWKHSKKDMRAEVERQNKLSEWRKQHGE